MVAMQEGSMSDYQQQEPALEELPNRRSPSALDTPEEPAPTTERYLRLTLAGAVEEVASDFVVVTVKAGLLSPQDILQHANPYTLVRDLEDNGAQLHEPVLFSWTTNDKSHQLYVTPTPTTDFRSQAEWIDTMVATVRAWGMDSVGLYLSPVILGDQPSLDLLARTTRCLHEKTNIREICFIVGRNSYGAMLNLTLALKAELDRAHCPVHVLH